MTDIPGVEMQKLCSPSVEDPNKDDGPTDPLLLVDGPTDPLIEKKSQNPSELLKEVKAILGKLVTDAPEGNAVDVEVKDVENTEEMPAGAQSQNDDCHQDENAVKSELEETDAPDGNAVDVEVKDVENTEEMPAGAQSQNDDCHQDENAVKSELERSVQVLLVAFISAKAKGDPQVKRDELDALLRKVFMGEDAGQTFMKITGNICICSAADGRCTCMKNCRNKNMPEKVGQLVLDSMIDDGPEESLVVRYDVLDASIDGTEDGRTVFQELATNSNLLINHDLCRLYTWEKWKKLRTYCYLSFALYMFITFSLIYTLVTSVMADDVYTYESGLDVSRGVFEVISAISVFGCLLIELYQIRRSRCYYFTDMGNWVELSSSLLLTASIPLRFTSQHVHWYFFAFGYFIWISQWRKQSILFKYFYIQAEMFVQVLKNDVLWFSLLFLVINIAFTGASYLTLKGDNSLHLNNETSTFPEIFFMGVRTLAEGQPVLEYYGNEEYSYSTMNIIVIVVFLFATCVLLLNMLIAQMSKTLDNVSETIETNYQMKLAFTLAWMEINISQFLSKCCIKKPKNDPLVNVPEKDWRRILYQPVGANEKILSKTKKMEKRQAVIQGHLRDIRDTYSSDELRSIREKVSSLKTEINTVTTGLDRDFGETLDMALIDIRLLPGQVKDILNDFATKVEGALQGKLPPAKKDKADAKKRPRKEQTDLNGDVSIKKDGDLMGLRYQQIKGVGKDETDACDHTEWEKTMNEDQQHQILGFIEKCRLEGANPATWMIDSKSPLVAAVDNGHYQVLRLLLDLLDQLQPNSQDEHAKPKKEALQKALDKKYDHSAAILVNNLNKSEPKRWKVFATSFFI